MRSKYGPMGRFAVDIEIVNNEDLVRAKHGFIDASQVRRVTIKGWVDTGAAYLVLPQSVVDEIGLPLRPKKLKVRYADGRRATRSEADEARVFLLGRDGIFRAIVEPKRDTALIGAIVLEDLDLLIDAKNQKLYPRDPESVFAEIE